MKTMPTPSLRRLVLLGRLLGGYGEKTITSQQIESLTGWSAAVVRRDISLLEVRCGASNGYKVAELKAALDSALAFSRREQRCCIVGLGRMGQVLLDNSELEEAPFRLVAGFDSNVNRTEVLRSIFPLHPTTLLETVVERERIEYAILTAHAREAQGLASRLAACGIKGIVNYTPCVLSVPPQTKVENVSPLMALELLAVEQGASGA